MKEITIRIMKYCHHYFFIFFFVLFSQSLFAKLIIITDIDDTIRRTETINPARGLMNLVNLRVPPYEGIRKLYWDFWASHSQTEFFYLSSSLKEIYDADDWLGRMQFPLGKTLQRSREQFLKEAEENYKIHAILSYLKNESPDTEVYFFGDTSFSDETIYLEVIKKLGLKKTKIFIHDVNGSTVFKTMKQKLDLQSQIHYYISEIELIDLLRFPDSLNWVSLETEYVILKEYYRRSGLSSGLGPNLYLELRDQYCTNKMHAFKGCSVKAEIESAFFINWYHKRFLR